MEAEVSKKEIVWIKRGLCLLVLAALIMGVIFYAVVNGDVIGFTLVHPQAVRIAKESYEAEVQEGIQRFEARQHSVFVSPLPEEVEEGSLKE